MAWFKVDDGMAFHAKVMAAKNEAVGAWARAGAWSSAPANLTDGFIPFDVAHAIAPARVWKRLIDAKAGHEHGLADETTGGYQLHDFLDYNPNSESVRENRAEVSAKRSQAGSKGAAKRWQKHGKADGKAMANPSQTKWQTDGPDPDPGSEIPPTPHQAGGHPEPLRGSGGNSDLPDDFAEAGAADQDHAASPPLDAPAPVPRRRGSPKGPASEKSHERYGAAYAAGMTDATGDPFTPPTDSHAQLIFRTVLPVHAIDDAGQPLRGDDLLAWIRASSAEYRRALKPADVRFNPGFKPSHWKTWLDAGKPGAAAPKRGGDTRYAPLDGRVIERPLPQEEPIVRREIPVPPLAALLARKSPAAPMPKLGPTGET